jgi:hypothetical protein
LLTVLILAPVLSAVLSLVLVLSILHFLTRVPGSAVAEGRVADPRLLRDIVEPFRQHGTVEVKQFGGVVYYPVPYASPPHLKLTAPSTERSFVIVRQDELGFTWSIDLTLKDGKSLFGAFKGVKSVDDLPGALAGVDRKALPALKPGAAFTWEARGVRPFTTAAATPPFVQSGTFTILPGGPHEGVVYFPHPYSITPNVTLSTTLPSLAVGPTGFRWSRGYASSGDTVTWTARGLRATVEHVAEFARRAPPLGPQQQQPLLEQNGSFTYAYGETGEVCFPRPFASPPNVEVHYVLVTEVTPRGFKWKQPHDKPTSKTVQTTQWKAKGVPAAKP